LSKLLAEADLAGTRGKTFQRKGLEKSATTWSVQARNLSRGTNPTEKEKTKKKGGANPRTEA